MKTIIVQLERSLPDGIVTTVHWRCEKDETSAYGSVGLPQPETEPIPFEDLTEEQIIEWLSTQIDFEEIKANLDAQIQAIQNPTSVSGLPWETQTQEDNDE
jgi:hypothetical protein